MSERLIALLGGREVGRVTRSHGRLAFVYDDAWRSAPDSYPLSLSMPIAAAEHGHAVVDAWLWGLLPDNAFILERWGRRFQVSARNPLALMAHVGEDCAGAVQFVRPERVERLRVEGPGAVDWLDEAGVASRLRALRGDRSAWRQPDDAGQFSLAGAQPKTALLFERGRWGVPSGRRPTTHILKPPTADFDGHVENEHFCLALARELGLPAAASQVARFEREIAIVVERYDRVRTAGGLVRVHQEDTCQALGIPPTKKYESEGGPGAQRLVELLRGQSSARDEDVDTFVGAFAFNWLIAGSDAHAKNFSLLIASGGRVRLAPLYDLASALPYTKIDQGRLRLAMKLGGEYRLRQLGVRHWRRLAHDLRLDGDALVARVAAMADAIPDAAAAVRRAAAAAGLRHGLVDRLAALTTKRATACRTALGTTH